MDQEDSLKVIQLTWCDPHSVDEWSDIKELEESELCIITSVGILLREDDHRLIVCLNLDVSNMNASCTMIIPKFAVKHLEVIGYVKAEKGT